MLFFLETLNPEQLLFNPSSYLLSPPSPLKIVIAILKQMHVGGFHGARQQLFTERALQPELIGHDVFQCSGVNTDALVLQVF